MALKYGSSMYIGETSNSIPNAVFFDPHSAIYNNKPPGTVITGSPGSGKTFFASMLAAQSAISGKTTVIVDYKGDFLSLMNLQDEIGKVTLWNLTDPGKAGLLDPYYAVKDPFETFTLVMEFIEMTLGGFAPQQEAAITPIIKDIIETSNLPSMQTTIDAFNESEKDAARDVAARLSRLANSKIGKLVFAPGSRHMNKVNIGTGTTVITMEGFDIPQGAAEESNISGEVRLSLSILYLLTGFLKRVMNNDESDAPKTIIIDEAWAFLTSDKAAEAVRSLALLGRSKSLALILSTQNNSHLEKLDIDTTITNRFAFQSTNDEAKDIVKGMNLAKNEGFEQVITGLKKGECLMKDWLDRYSTVKIVLWNKDWEIAFNTNPLDKLKQKRFQEKNKKN